MRTIGLTPSDIKIFSDGLAEYHSKYNMLFLVAVVTGLRVGDLVALKVRDVKTTHLEVIEGKTKKLKECSLLNIWCDLKYYIKENGLKVNDYLFYSANNRHGKPITRSQVYKIFKKNADICGIAGVVSPHSCRKSYARQVYAETGDIFAVQRALNHSRISDTMLYLHDIGVTIK
jgi:integrase